MDARAPRASPESNVSLMVILSLAVQIGLIAHVIKTGRSMIWILALAFLPLAGPLAYVVVEILPEAFGGRTARRARSSVGRMLDPDRDLRRAAAEVEVSGNVDARRRLADELCERGQFEQAAAVYQGGLNGIFEHDPALLLGLAQAQFGMRVFDAARATLERLRQHNSELNSSQAGLLYARTLEEQGALEEAEHAYAEAEGRLRYALLLKRRGKLEEARRMLKDLLDGAKLGPAHYRRAQARWLDLARREL